MILKVWQATLALLNAMLKGVILLLPILALDSGWLQTIIIILVSSFFSFYSCYIYIHHMGTHSDVDKSIYYHFWNSKIITGFYNLAIFVNMLLTLIAYFILIVQQWIGLVGDSIAIPILNAIFLFFLIILLKYIRFGAQFLGYGMISIFIYCIFLIWMLASAPSGQAKMKVFGSNYAPTAAAIAQAISIQPFFIPILKQLPNHQAKNFQRITGFVYIIGGLIYLFIGIVGSYGILNRTDLRPYLKSIESYFPPGQWQVIILQIIYLIHIYSVYGWFTIIAKKRLFCILHMIWRIKNSKSKQFFTLPESILVISILVICLIIYFLGITAEAVIIINGSVVGFFYIYLIPSILHFKCIFLPRPKAIFQVVYGHKQFNNELSEWQVSSKQKTSKQMAIQSQQQISQRYTQTVTQTMNQKLIKSKQKKQNKPNQQQLPGADLSIDLQVTMSTPSVSKIDYQCDAQIPQDMISLIGMIGFGIFIMIVGVQSALYEQF